MPATNVATSATMQKSALQLSVSAITGPGAVPGVGRGLGAPRGGFAGGFAPRGGFAGGPRPATCYKCGGPNHFARDVSSSKLRLGAQISLDTL